MAGTSNRQNNLSWMTGPLRSRFVRRLAVVVVSIILVLWLALIFLPPLFVKNEDIRDTVRKALYDNTGFRIEIQGQSELSFWPMPHISIQGIKVYPSDPHDKTPFLTAAAVSGTVDLWSVLTGSPALSRVELTQADLRIVTRPGGRNNLEAHRPAKTEPATKDTSPAPPVIEDSGATTEVAKSSFPVKEVVLVNSSLELIEDNRVTISLKNTNGNLRWPGLKEKLSFNITTDFRNKTLTFKGGTTQASELLNGRNGQLDFSIRSSFLNADFNGLGNLSANAFVAGDFKMSSEMLPELLAWLGDPVHAPVPIRSIDVSSKLATAGTNLTLKALQLQVDGIPASGAIEIGLPSGGTPSLSGTLAFGTFDIYGFLSTFTPVPGGQNADEKNVNTAFLRQLKLDLRLSADKASYGPINLTSMAASARIDDRFASFDIAASRLGRASVTARLTLDERNLPQRKGTLRIDTGKIDIGALVKTLNIPGPMPNAKGNLTAELTADLPFWAVAPTDISGKLSVNTGAGSLTNFDAVTFRKKAAEGGFFNISEVADSSLNYDQLAFDTRIENGLVEIVTAKFEGTDNSLSLKGIIPYRSQSLALTGTLSSSTSDNDEVQFFAGGAWPDIVITPVSAMIRSQTPRQLAPKP